MAEPSETKRKLEPKAPQDCVEELPFRKKGELDVQANFRELQDMSAKNAVLLQ